MSNIRIEEISHEENVYSRVGHDQLNILWHANSQMNEIKKQSSISSVEHMSIKVISKNDANVNEEEIHSLKSSRDECHNGENIEDQNLNVKQKRKYQENKKRNGKDVLNLNQTQNMRKDSKHLSDSMNHERSILFDSLKQKYEKRVSTKNQKHVDHEIQSKHSSGNRLESSIIDTADNKPISMKKEKRKHRSIQNNNMISETSNNNQDERIKAQLEHETSVLTNYLNQFDSLTVQLIKNVKAKRMKNPIT